MHVVFSKHQKQLISSYCLCYCLTRQFHSWPQHIVDLCCNLTDAMLRSNLPMRLIWNLLIAPFVPFPSLGPTPLPCWPPCQRFQQHKMRAVCGCFVGFQINAFLTHGGMFVIIGENLYNWNFLLHVFYVVWWNRRRRASASRILTLHLCLFIWCKSNLPTIWWFFSVAMTICLCVFV